MKSLLRVEPSEAEKIVDDWCAVFRQNGILLQIVRIEPLPICVYDNVREVKENIKKQFKSHEEYEEYSSGLDSYIEWAFTERYGGLVRKDDFCPEGLTFKNKYYEIYINNLRNGNVAEMKYRPSEGWIVSGVESLQDLDLCSILHALSEWSTYMKKYIGIAVEWKLCRKYDENYYIPCSARELHGVIIEYFSMLDDDMLSLLKGMLKSKVKIEIFDLEMLIIE